jgi:hypothetical protein
VAFRPGGVVFTRLPGIRPGSAAFYFVEEMQLFWKHIPSGAKARTDFGSLIGTSKLVP